MMQRWEYMWLYVTNEGGRQVFVANGARLQVQTYFEALNALGNDGWELVAIMPPGLTLPAGPQSTLQFCLKRALPA